MTHDSIALADSLLAMPDESWPDWLTVHAGALTLALIEELKRRSDRLIKDDPSQAERTTRAAIAVASVLTGEPLAYPKARWARGNWAAFNQPAEAVVCYQDALAAYQAEEDVEAIGRLSSNLVFAYTSLGRFPEAIAAAEAAQRTLSGLGSTGEPYLVNLAVNYGWLLYEHGHYDQALTANEAALPLALRLGMLEEWAELQVNQAFTLSKVGRIDESEELLLDSRELLAQMGRRLTVARIDMNLGELYTARGRLAAALQRFHMALEEFSAANVLMDYASTQLFEAELLARVGAFAAALRTYARAQQRFAEHDMQQYVAMALLAGAIVRRHINPSDAGAERMLGRAAEIAADLGLPLLTAEVQLERAALALSRKDAVLAETLLTPPLPSEAPPTLTVRRALLLGDLYEWQEKHVEAHLVLKDALQESRRASLLWAQRDVLARLGRLLFDGDPDTAGTYLAQAADLDDSIRVTLSVEELTASFVSGRGDVLPLLVRLAIKQGHPLRALLTAWRWNGGALLDLMSSYETSSRLADDGHPDLERLRQQAEALRWRIVRAVQDEEDPQTIEALQNQLREFQQQLTDQRRRSHHTNTGKGSGYKLPDDPRKLLDRLTADRLVEYVRCGDELLALCTDREGHCTATCLGSVLVVQDLLSRLELKHVRFLRLTPEQRSRQLGRLEQEAQRLLHQIYTVLFAPLPNLPATGSLLIAPCAPLHLVPFSALWDGAGYLVQRYELQSVPSGALLAVSHTPGGRAGPPLIIGASAEGRLGSVASEITAVAAACPGSVSYLDDPTALEHLRSLQQAPRLLHLSTHTEFDDEPSIFSGLQLAGGMLTIERCYELRLAGTELVVLNGCTTAAGMESGGALLAFQSALLVAGARQVLASLWPINDALAATTMTTFYHCLTDGLRPTAALRAAQQKLLNNPETAHPAVWGAFAVTGR